MNDQEEAAYMRGQRAIWLRLLSECLRNLGYESSEAKQAGWITEREEAIAILRDICTHHGDNEWNESLHLADIIDKHLGNHLG